MPTLSETAYDLTPHERVEVVDRSATALTVRATYAPGGSPPPMHLHPSQDERFEVLAGTLTVEIHGTRRPLRAGAALAVPRGTPHRMWNADPEEARVTWTTAPPGRTEAWWADLHAARGGRDRPPLPRMLRLLREYRDVFRVVLRPRRRAVAAPPR